MKIKFNKYLIILLFLISIILVSISLGRCLFSKQGEINPDTIKDEYDPKATTAIFNNQIVKIPERSFDNEKVLGVSENKTESNKRIEVDLSKQMTYAYEGNNLVYSFLISSGKWNRTPTGTFKVWTKVKSQKMSGGSKELGTYYYLPNVHYVMFFYNDKIERKLGYSFHEAYWHNNFGVPMSHGCINMTLTDSSLLYNWAEVGTTIVIKGKYEVVLPRV